MILSSFSRDWSARPTREMLAGAVATFALIPEVIAFSFAAGVDPQVGLFASFVIGIVIAFTGGRPAMISAAAGSVALVAAPLVHSHGLPYLLAAGLLAGVIQILFGLLRLGVLMRFVSKSVRTGFVNALAILIFSAQMPQVIGAGWATYAVLAAGLALIYLLPLITTAIPSPLICIVVLTVASVMLHLPVKTVADLGRLPDSLPIFAWPSVPLTFETLGIIAGPALAIAMVGLLESMMTASVVDDLTNTPSSKNREATGLGLANAAASLFGGIAGCGMIGQTVSNIKYGGRGRLSTLFAGAFLLILMVLLKPWVSQVPVAALVAIMVMVSIDTFDWSSLRAIVIHPKMSSTVMLATVAVTVATSNLAMGVAVGVLLSGVFFAFKVARLMDVTLEPAAVDGQSTFRVTGQVFFASADLFVDAFDVAEFAGKSVVIDVSRAHFWDITAVAALDRVVARFRAQGANVDVRGMNKASSTLVETLDRPSTDNAS
ncbi:MULTISPECIES: SulP family inorganic anion transporter [unclassified Rhizobium]|uniref:SulP family inorganic anion transporter n=1 Tax=unclassified Rhizobium TaxID=2613769 RepID=UPI001ADB2437|nr:MULTISPECIES: SulP family inorganic anion transporter [unclassified Rhizobium]MBO9099161.1 SulP family inorganic anion transporter [Rhizobium sp. L58/93]MBO9132033.1 SulP family inorganic anion transporter [Rhizobium sp. B209b/85]MBO9169423.1 SulP family inorganic anion transporter [Rhizobium sp. L245/93]MBO9185374.1 SulP family inorganic anion transporter [Rhizobium sp. E27B/91]QXZ85512.1 SulP family inorganic anion transporter [Rhizobium sp. K1/93]